MDEIVICDGFTLKLFRAILNLPPKKLPLSFSWGIGVANIKKPT
jgi:hypothetical protein